MKFRLLNFLACPHDRQTPLRVYVFREQPRPGTRPLPRCEFHCALRDRPAEQATAEDCQRCADTEVLEGVLVCDECQRWFPISDGIPTLFPDDLRQHDEAFLLRHRAEMAGLGLTQPALLSERAASASAAEVARMQSERRARDQQAEQYDRMLSLRVYRAIEAPAYFDALRAAPPGPLLEAGCGTGRLTDVFTAVSDEVLAADFSLTSIHRNRRRHASSPRTIHYLQCDLTRLPLRAACVTAIAHAGVYEHIPSRELRLRWLAHARRALRPGGRFLVSAYRYGGLTCFFGKEGEHAGGIPFVRFTESELREELSQEFAITRFRASLGLYLSMAVCEVKGG